MHRTANIDIPPVGLNGPTINRTIMINAATKDVHVVRVPSKKSCICFDAIAFCSSDGAI